MTLGETLAEVDADADADTVVETLDEGEGDADALSRLNAMGRNTRKDALIVIAGDMCHNDCVKNVHFLNLVLWLFRLMSYLREEIEIQENS